MPKIQQLLEECGVGVDRSCNSVYALLVQEWRPGVAGVLRCGQDNAETDDVLTACISDKMRPPSPRAIAPESAVPKAWRTRIVKNFVIDYIRTRDRQRSCDRAGSEEFSVEEIRQQRNEAKRLRTQKGNAQEPAVENIPVSVFRPAQGSASVQNQTIDARNLLRENLPKLGVRRRLALVFEYGFSPWVWLSEFASELNEPIDEVRERIETYEKNRGSLEYRARIFRYEGELTEAKNAYRKLVTNDVKDLRALMASGRSA